MSFDRNLLQYPRQFFSSLNMVRVPLAVAVLASLALYGPPQTHEIYRILAQDLPTDWPQILASYVSLFLAGWILWTTAYYLTQTPADDSGSGKSADSLMLRWLPCLIGAAPIVACGFGILQEMHAVLGQRGKVPEQGLEAVHRQVVCRTALHRFAKRTGRAFGRSDDRGTRGLRALLVFIVE